VPLDVEEGDALVASLETDRAESDFEGGGEIVSVGGGTCQEHGYFHAFSTLFHKPLSLTFFVLSYCLKPSHSFSIPFRLLTISGSSKQTRTIDCKRLMVQIKHRIKLVF
jgi:hypothetical protein